MMLICEQVDGYRVTGTNDPTNTVMYFKKSNGWTQLLVEEIVCILNTIPERLTRSYKEGYLDGQSNNYECEFIEDDTEVPF